MPFAWTLGWEARRGAEVDPGQVSWMGGPGQLGLGPGMLFICGMARTGLKRGSSGGNS